MFRTRLFLLLFLFNTVHGMHKSPHLRSKVYQRLKPVSADYDNRYVWFTRNIHSEVQSEQPDANEIRKRYFNGFFYRKESTVKVEKLLTT